MIYDKKPCHGEFKYAKILALLSKIKLCLTRLRLGGSESYVNPVGQGWHEKNQAQKNHPQKERINPTFKNPPVCGLFWVYWVF